MLETTVENEATGQHETLTVPITLLMRFAALDTPSRQEWNGKRELYGECAKFFDAHGMLEKQSNGGYRWRTEYPKHTRKDWLLQFEE